MNSALEPQTNLLRQNVVTGGRTGRVLQSTELANAVECNPSHRKTRFAGWLLVTHICNNSAPARRVLASAFLEERTAWR